MEERIRRADLWESGADEREWLADEREALSHEREALDDRQERTLDGREADWLARDVIGQAKGILMKRQHLSAGDAFDLLRRASQRLNRKLADVAQDLTETGELPT